MKSFAPVFVSPNMQWAVPQSHLQGPPVHPAACAQPPMMPMMHPGMGPMPYGVQPIHHGMPPMPYGHPGAYGGYPPPAAPQQPGH